MAQHLTNEKNALVILALLKAHGIRNVIASPGTTNMALVGSMQNDPFFRMFSAPDERSAAYMACGLAAETNKPVVISCTGATASRNYLPGLTEAFYRKLPVLAITSTQQTGRVGHHVAQVIDRSVLPRDCATLSLALPVVKDDEDFWECEVKVNRAILELSRHGGGPAHLNLPTTYSSAFDVLELPYVRKFDRVTQQDAFPVLTQDCKVAVFIGSHSRMNSGDVAAIERFCESNNSVVFCDHTSGYHGRYRLLYSLVAGQECDLSPYRPDLLVHLGEVTGDYYTLRLCGAEVWRVSPDGEIRDTFRKLTKIFEMPESVFFSHYSKTGKHDNVSYFDFCHSKLCSIRSSIPDLPFSNPWVAQKLAPRIPEGAVVHFGILNSLRVWNFFPMPELVDSASNVGGFGIDGCVSSLLGASLANQNRLYFAVIGDLAFFYDMNALGNRHVGNNLRILLVNNGKGTEFRQSSHHAAPFGTAADEFIAAAGHYGNKSPLLVKHYAEDLGFQYISASTKVEFESVYESFLAPKLGTRPIVFEVFTESQDESDALELMLGIWPREDPIKSGTVQSPLKQLAKQALGQRGVRVIKKIVGRD